MDTPRTLVSVFLRGGLDGLNAVVPTFEDAYRELRPTIAIERRKSGDTGSGRAIPLDDRFALHASLEPLLPLYREGRMAVLHAVGSDDDTRSHFEAQDQMEHGASVRAPLGSGWAARWLRTRASSPWGRPRRAPLRPTNGHSFPSKASPTRSASPIYRPPPFAPGVRSMLTSAR